MSNIVEADEATVDLVTIPDIFKKYLNQEDAKQWTQLDLHSCTVCSTCNLTARTVDRCLNVSRSCLLVHCYNRGKSAGRSVCNNWYVCLLCRKRVNKRKVKTHFSIKHIPTTQSITSQRDLPFVSADETTVASRVVARQLLLEHDDDAAEFDWTNEVIDDGISLFNVEVDNHSLALMSEITEDATSTFLTINKANPATSPIDWLYEAFADVPIAEAETLIMCFDGLSNMRLYWLCERQAPGRGLRHLVTRMFTNSPHTYKLVSLSESIWHLKCYMQYTAMNDSQRRRQGDILGQLQPYIIDKMSSTGITKHVNYRQMSKYYGRSTKNSMGNILPSVPVQNVFGIAYVNPIHVVKLMFANSHELDDMVFLGNNKDESTLAPTSVNYISESKAGRRMYQDAKRYATEINYPDTPGKEASILMVWAVDWRDGFGANRVKQNRKPVVAWTLSLSPPKDKVNTIDNTFPIALGLKKNVNWNQVELLFHQHLRELTGKPIYVYHGKLRKVIPILVRRIASLEDKVERAEYTATLSCTSNYHRCFGKIIRFDNPSVDKTAVKAYLDNQKKGLADNQLNAYSWCADFYSSDVNSSRFPACLACRNKTIDCIFRFNQLTTSVIMGSTRISSFSDEKSDVEKGQVGETEASENASGATSENSSGATSKMSCCANWVLDESTRVMLSFPADKDYPQFSLDNAPEHPPLRAVGLQKLEFMEITFTTLKQACKFAFHNSKGGRRSSWTKVQCCEYLRCCGVNVRQQELLYKAATEAYASGIDIDYSREDGIGSFMFPASWLSELELTMHIELIMHLLFLGVAESQFSLIGNYLTNNGLTSFKLNCNRLIADIAGFNLSWLLALPFAGQKLSTGPWVAENWQTWLRLSPLLYLWILKDGVKAKRNGAADVMRVVLCYHALVAQLLSHSSVTQRTVMLVELLTKEFLSSVRDLDTRLRYEELGAPNPKKAKLQWWLKSNYASLMNLCATLKELGPIINMYDGGGKGERYIQEIKPHIPRGVRDNGLFFIRLMERIYQLRITKRVETDVMALNNNSVQLTDSDSSFSSGRSLAVWNDHANNTANVEDGRTTESPPLRYVVHQGNTQESSQSDDTNSQDNSDDKDDSDDEEEWNSVLQDKQMSKRRTFYVYKNLQQLNDSYAAKKPLAGIVVKQKDSRPVMYHVFRKPGKQFGWCKSTFDDTIGLSFTGTWFAPVILEEDTLHKPPQSMKKLSKMAKLGSISIPLRYALDGEEEHREKYCVFTNWWKVRDSKGRFVQPTLDKSLYSYGSSQLSTNITK